MTTVGVADRGEEESQGREIVRLLERYGEPIRTSEVQRLALMGARILWLVTRGTLDLYAVASAENSGWHFLGRLEPGTILLGSVLGPRHGLFGRPHAGCSLRRIATADIARAQREEWVANRPPGGFSVEEELVAWGIDRGLRVLLDSTRKELPPAEYVPIASGDIIRLRAGQVARPASGVLWVGLTHGQMLSGNLDAYVSVPGLRWRRDSRHDTNHLPQLWGVADVPGPAEEVVAVSDNDSIRPDSDTLITARTTTQLIADGSLWGQLVEHNARFLINLDRLIQRHEQVRRARLVAGLAAAEAAHDTASRTLTTVLHTVANRERIEVSGGEPSTAVLRTVARATGITAPPSASTSPSHAQVDPIERAAAAARLRTRTVRLVSDWYAEDIGPLIARLRGTGNPVALLWRRGGYDIVDPAGGRRARLNRMRAKALEPTAVTLYRPLPDEPVSALRLARFALRGNRHDVFRCMLGSVVSVGISLLVPIATGAVLGTFVPNGERGLIIGVCIMLALSSLLSAAFSLLQNISVLRIEGRWESTVQAAVWDRLLRHPTSFFTRFSTGELASAVLGVTRIRQMVSGVASGGLQSTLSGVVTFGLLLWYSVSLALVACGLVLVGVVVFVAGGLRQLAFQREAVGLDYTLANTVFHMLRAVPKLRVAAAEDFAYAHWASDFARSRELEWRVSRIQRVVTAFGAAYLPFCTLVLFGLVTGPAKGLLSVGEFLTFYSAFGIMIAAIIRLTSMITSVGAIVPTFERLKPVLDQVPEVSSGRIAPGDLSGDIDVDEVSFRYTQGGPLVFDRISLHIERGEFVAIVGPTGAGKSTLLRLLIGFERPDTGSVRYDGQDLSSLDVTAVRRQFGVVLQSARPVAGTILSNICGGEPFSLDDAWEAARQAGLADDIAAMPMGMHTIITENMCTLSGGQQQRMMIARALIRRPRIIFLDEATSALDNESQRIVADHTRTLNATRVVVAHRLSTVMRADNVVVLADGKVVQQGPPAQLHDEDGLFRRLVRRQIQ